MDPVNPRHPHLYQRCREEAGVPVRFIGEQDIHVLPSTQEMWLEVEEGGLGRQRAMSGKEQHVGSRGRITTHRFIWWVESSTAWVALRLDGVASVNLVSAFMRTSYCQLAVASKQVDVKCKDAATAQELCNQLQVACQAGRWREGSWDVAALGGLQRVLGQRAAKQQVVGETIDAALGDLQTLKQHAAKTVAAARQIAAKQGGGEGGVESMLDDFGLLGADGRLVVKGGTSRTDVEADVLRVCEAALNKRGGLGMLLTHDIFCLVNRARGTALVSPEEVMSALQACKQTSKLRLRVLGSTGAWAASLPKSSEAEVDERILKLVDEQPLSTFQFGKELGLTTAEAQYVLFDVVGRGVLVRDEAPDGVYYSRNFFNDF